MKLRFLPAAYADIERLYDFLSSKNPRAADRVVDIIIAAAVSLKDAPQRGRPLSSSGFRELIVPFGKGAYVIRYRIDADATTTFVARIWHSREKR